MDGVMHPVGPEEERTYWIRRALALGVVVLLIIGIFAAANALNGAGKQTAESPAPAAAPETEMAPAPEGEPTPSANPTPAADRSAETETMPPDNPAPAPPGVSLPTSVNKPKSTPSAKEAAPAAGTCNPKDLEVKIASERKAKINAAVDYKLTVTNKGAAACSLMLTPKDYEFKISSGKDRIWSTADCTAKAPSFQKKQLKKGEGVTVDLSWVGLRSKAQCLTLPQALAPGTYTATLEVKKGKTAKFEQDLR